MTSLGDLDGDGVQDLAVGASSDDDGGFSRGAVWILFLNGNGPHPADLDRDGSVGPADLVTLLGAWGKNPSHPADFDGDGVVDAADLIDFLGNWGSNR